MSLSGKRMRPPPRICGAKLGDAAATGKVAAALVGVASAWTLGAPVEESLQDSEDTAAAGLTLSAASLLESSLLRRCRCWAASASASILSFFLRGPRNPVDKVAVRERMSEMR